MADVDAGASPFRGSCCGRYMAKTVDACAAKCLSGPSSRQHTIISWCAHQTFHMGSDGAGM